MITGEFDIKTETARDGASFVGIIISEKLVTVSFPIGYRASSYDGPFFREDVKLLIKILHNTSREKGLHSTKFFLDCDLPFNSYVWIVQNYFENGLFKNKRKIYKKNAVGKVVWKKTLEKRSYFNEEGSPVFLDLIHLKKQNISNIITLIHQFCLSESSKYIGWLFDFNFKKCLLPLNNKNKILQILKKQLTHEFEDKNKQLLSHMINIIQGVGSNKKNTNVKYGTTHFEHIWERMVDNAFSNVSVDKFYPSAKWHINNDEYKPSNMRPDTIVEDVDKNIVYILDAKYYKYGNTFELGDLPSTSDIAKQIIYAQFVEKRFHYFDIYNAFIVPYNRDYKSIHKDIVYWGYAKPDFDLSEKKYNKIALVLIDAKALMKFNVSNSKKEITEQLIKEIEKI